MTMDDVLRDFLTETNENLVRLEHEVLELERAPTNGELLNSIFRTVHTVKGTCGFFELPRLKHVAHACESVLSLVRNGRLDASRPVMTAVLEAIDVIRNILAALEQRGAEPSGDDAEVIAQLDAFKRAAELREPSSVVALAASPTISPDALSHASSTPTAVQRVTNVSSRGVGMDVVHTNIAQIGGVVELSTQPGVGTTIRARLPERCYCDRASRFTPRRLAGDRLAAPRRGTRAMRPRRALRRGFLGSRSGRRARARWSNGIRALARRGRRHR